jgi:PAS domain S-box-containing protein
MKMNIDDSNHWLKMEGLPFAAIVCNANGEIASISKAAQRVLRQSESLLLGQKIYDVGFINKDEYDNIRNDYYHRPDDTFHFYFDDRYLEIEFASMEEATGERTKTQEIFVLRDYSQLANEEDFSTDCNNKACLEKLQELSNNGYGIFNIEERTFTLSKTAMQLLRMNSKTNVFPADKFIKRHLSDESKTVLQRTVFYAVEQKTEFRAEFDFTRDDGHTRYIRLNAKTNYDSNGKAISIIGVLSDITEFREHETAHAEYMAITDSMLESINAGIVVLDFKSQVRTYNIVLMEMLKLSGKKLIGLTIKEFAKTIDEVLDTGGYFENIVPFILNQSGTNMTKSFLTDDGKTIEIAINRSDSFDNQQTTVFLFKDITERIQTQNQLVTYNKNLKFAVSNLEETVKNMQDARKIAEEAQTMQSLFVSNVTHDLRSPINTVLGFADLMEASNLNETQREYLDTIRDRCNDQLFLINDLLALSSIQTGKLQIQYSEFKFIDLLQDVKKSIDLKLKDKRVKFEINMPDSFPETITQDRNRIRQIIINLLDNATKFTDNGTISLDINTYKSENKTDRKTLEIKVRDTGIGIPDEEQDTIFSPFIQVRGQSKKIGGSGLGLAIVKELTGLLNGEIKLTSRINEGSQFTVTLFDVKTSENIQILTTKKEFANASSISGSKILIITDEQDNMKFDFLREIGAEVYILHNHETLHIMQVILDFHPEIIIEEIKSESNLNLEYLLHVNGKSKGNLGIPVIAITEIVMSDTNKDFDKYYDSVLAHNVNEDKIISDISRFISNEEYECVAFRKDSDYTIDKIILTLNEEQKTYIQRNIENLKTISDSVNDSFILSRLNYFSLELLKFGQEADIEYMISLSERLTKALENYKIDSLLEILAEIKLLIDKLAK